MKPINKTIIINAPAEKVWEVLWSNYSAWTAPFSPGSYMEGTPVVGEVVRFLGPDPTDNKIIGGLVAKVVEFTPGKAAVFSFLGFVSNGVEVTEGPGVEDWVGLTEEYHLNESEGVTTLVTNAVMDDENYDFMDHAWDQALEIVKTLSEST